MRWMAYIVGFGGGKEKGIGMIETAASHGQQQVDATIALTLIYTREHRYADALRLIRDLERRYPQNRLVLEEGATNLRLGQPRDADAVLTAGLDRLSRDPRARIPGELALWLYKRGAARVALGRKTDATADLEPRRRRNPSAGCSAGFTWSWASWRIWTPRARRRWRSTAKRRGFVA